MYLLLCRYQWENKPKLPRRDFGYKLLQKVFDWEPVSSHLYSQLEQHFSTAGTKKVCSGTKKWFEIHILSFYFMLIYVTDE